MRIKTAGWNRPSDFAEKSTFVCVPKTIDEAHSSLQFRILPEMICSWRISSRFRYYPNRSEFCGLGITQDVELYNLVYWQQATALDFRRNWHTFRALHCFADQAKQ